MADGADQALERAAMECDLFDKLQDAPFQEQYDAGLIEEDGSVIGNPNSFPGITHRRPAPQGLWDM